MPWHPLRDGYATYRCRMLGAVYIGTTVVCGMKQVPIKYVEQDGKRYYYNAFTGRWDAETDIFGNPYVDPDESGRGSSFF